MPDALAEAEALAARCKAAFKKYDTNGNGTIERDELTGALEDLGLLKGVDKPSIGSFVIDMFAKLDTDGNQHLSYKEFAELYNSVVREKMIMNAGSSHGKGSDLHAVFIRFANFGKKLAKPAEDMDGKNWAKFCKDCGPCPSRPAPRAPPRAPARRSQKAKHGTQHTRARVVQASWIRSGSTRRAWTWCSQR